MKHDIDNMKNLARMMREGAEILQRQGNTSAARSKLDQAEAIEKTISEIETESPRGGKRKNAGRIASDDSKTELIQFRISKNELQQLAHHQRPGESKNMAARRLFLEILGS